MCTVNVKKKFRLMIFEVVIKEKEESLIITHKVILNNLLILVIILYSSDSSIMPLQGRQVRVRAQHLVCAGRGPARGPMLRRHDLGVLRGPRAAS